MTAENVEVKPHGPFPSQALGHVLQRHKQSVPVTSRYPY